ncbi:MAG: hypothetical protein AAFQ68_04690, partial [Bacteroidota bacterium]
AEQRANQAVDKGLDKLEDAIFGKKSESTPATPTPTSGTDSSASPSSTPVLFPQSDDSSGFSPFGMGNAEVEPFESRAFGNENSPAGVIGKGPYGLESAFVVQKTTTEGMQAVSSLMYDTLRFVDYGQLAFRAQRQIQEINMMGIKRRDESLAHIYLEGDSMFNINPLAGTGIRMLNPAAELYQGMSEAEAERFAKQVENNMNTKSKRLGTERLHGLVCEVMDFETYDTESRLMFVSRMWFYQGFVIQSQSRGMGAEIQVETISIQLQPSFSRSLFERPTDIRYTSFSHPFGQ